MKNLFYLTIFCLMASFLIISGCQSVSESNFLSENKSISKNDCEISKTEAEEILGEPVRQLDKNSPFLGIDGKAKTHPKFRACGFIGQKDKNNFSHLYWYNSEFNDREQAQQFFKETFKNNPQSSRGETIKGIGNEAILFQDANDQTKEISIIVWKGRNVFYLKKNVRKDKAISADEIKLLAQKISLNTTD